MEATLIKIILGGSVTVNGEGSNTLPSGGNDGDLLLKVGSDEGVAGWKSANDNGIVTVGENGKIPDSQIPGYLIADLGNIESLDALNTLLNSYNNPASSPGLYHILFNGRINLEFEVFSSFARVVQVLRGTILIDNSGNLTGEYDLKDVHTYVRDNYPTAGVFSSWVDTSSKYVSLNEAGRIPDNYLNGNLIKTSNGPFSDLNTIISPGYYYYVLDDTRITGTLQVTTDNSDSSETIIYQKRYQDGFEYTRRGVLLSGGATATWEDWSIAGSYTANDIQDLTSASDQSEIEHVFNGNIQGLIEAVINGFPIVNKTSLDNIWNRSRTANCTYNSSTGFLELFFSIVDNQSLSIFVRHIVLDVSNPNTVTVDVYNKTIG